MPPVTIKHAIAETLEDLSKENYLKFCDQLRDRREEPRVSRRAVEGKRPWEIADVLVSTFTETKALQVALDLLSQINCNEEAKILESKTRVFVDISATSQCNANINSNMREMELKTLEEARHRQPKEVLAEVKACDLSDGGNPGSERLQFGKYKGQTFERLLENNASYAAFIVASHRMAKKSTPQQDPLTANKDSLTKYAEAYPKVMEAVKFKCAGEAHLGFGKYQRVKLKNLYESKNCEKISYVDYLRSMKSDCTKGSKMEEAIQYILWRDQRPYPN